VLANAQQTLSTAGFGSTNMWKSYEMSGAFLGFLIYKYGPEKFARYYGDTDIKKYTEKTSTR